VSLGQPTWQPDGSAIYFIHTGSSQGSTSRSTQIQRQVLATGEHQVVVEDAVWPAVSPDGRLLAFVQPARGASSAVWVLNLATGERRKLGDSRFLGVASPSFSPDGQTIAFGGATPPGTSRAPGSLAEGALARLDRWLAPRAFADGPPYGLWLAQADGTGLRRVSQATYDSPIVRWLGDGKRILVYEGNGLHLVDVGRGLDAVIQTQGSHGGLDWLPLNRPLHIQPR
jgi:Tol biopolymer transport system component